MRPGRLRWLAIAGIVTAPSACDNVSWGGTDVHLERPPPRDSLFPAPSPTDPEPIPEAVPELPQGAVLFAGARSGDRGHVVPIGEVVGDAINPFASDEAISGYLAHFSSTLMAAGREFVLFAEGARVGRLLAQVLDVDSSYCVPRPRATGPVELVPTAAGASRFLALASDRAAERPYGAYGGLRHTYEQRVASLNLAGEVIPQVQAAWPPSVLEARREIRAFQLLDAEEPSIAATFVHRDQLAVGPAPSGSYALFLMATASPAGYRPAHVWYRPSDEQGKGLPRYVDQLDWDGDGSVEVVLEVLGEDARWFAGLARRDTTWVRSFEDPCGAPPPSPPPGA